MHSIHDGLLRALRALESAENDSILLPVVVKELSVEGLEIVHDLVGGPLHALSSRLPQSLKTNPINLLP